MPNAPAPWICDLHHYFNFESNTTTTPKTSLKLNFDVKNLLPGTCFLGNLADQGFEQHRHLNTIWTELYPQFFQNKSYTPKTVRTTNKSRTRMSLCGQLRETSYASVSTYDLDSSVIPDACPADKRYWYSIQNGYDFENARLKEIQTKTNWNVWWDTFSDDFRSRAAMNAAFPDTLTQDDIDLANNMMDKYWCYMYQKNPNKDHQLLYSKMAIGAYCQDLIDLLNNKTEFHILSGHDTVVAPLAGVLVQDWACSQPDFASFIVLEVTDNMVKIRYRHDRRWLRRIRKITRMW
ncbi:Acid_phosphatase [Hexamita inflata]|uniref:Acid phosphatase n=1 Tax=Hexamita inflata TaxID=28002 RepID=A0AA86UX81_9EUKA|nr:Acid phosphatase [Hexamita inflata]